MEMMPNKSKKGEIAMNKEELRKEVLKLIYDKGGRYIARDEDGIAYIYRECPVKEKKYWFNTGINEKLRFLDVLFQDITFEDKEPLNIAKELGIVDWSTIPENTKVLASNDGKTWERRHFKEYQEDKRNPFLVYAYGMTSWSATGEHAIRCKYCKLAEEQVCEHK